jgi:hypothetical protein
MDNPVWPTTVQNLAWPEDGLTYSYENRGYIKPEKVGRWLSKAFGEGNGKYAVSSPGLLSWKQSLLSIFIINPSSLSFCLCFLSVNCVSSKRSDRFNLRIESPFPGFQPIFRSVQEEVVDIWQVYNRRIYIKAPREPTKVCFNHSSCC